MSSDEDDYMSDKYLAKESEDLRPGIPKRKVDERALEQYKKKLKSTNPSKGQQEAIQRDEGLNTALPSSNKGFQMLAKMGYKSGTSLGASNSGIIEPIGISLKADKGGLGKKPKAAIQSRKTPIIEVTKEMQDTYRRGIQERKNTQMIRKFYYRAQTSCMNLDHEHHVVLPVKEFFWPRTLLDDMRKKEKRKQKEHRDCPSEELDLEETSEDDTDEDNEEIVNEDLLRELVSHLRTAYFYCIYCAAKATDAEDLNSFCPGEDYEDHDLD